MFKYILPYVLYSLFYILYAPQPIVSVMPIELGRYFIMYNVANNPTMVFKASNKVIPHVCWLAWNHRDKYIVIYSLRSKISVGNFVLA
jgi:hypothetical protein